MVARLEALPGLPGFGLAKYTHFRFVYLLKSIFMVRVMRCMLHSLFYVAQTPVLHLGSHSRCIFCRNVLRQALPFQAISHILWLQASLGLPGYELPHSVVIRSEASPGLLENELPHTVVARL